MKVHTDGENAELDEKILDFLLFIYCMKFGFGIKLSYVYVYVT